MRSDKIPEDFEPKTTRELRFIYEEDGTQFLAQPIEYKKEFLYNGIGYDIQVDPDRAFVANGYVASNCRFYYENEPKVAAAIDFYCFEPSTPILMADGEQKPISSIKKGNIVRSHDGTVNKVVNVFKKQTCEEMLSIKIAGVSQGKLKCTKGHEILVKRDNDYIFVQAQHLVVGDYVLTPSNYGKSGSEISFEEKEFAWLLGLYSAEGCGIPYDHTTKSGKKTQRYKGIYIYLNLNSEKELAEEVKSRIDSLYGVDCSIRYLELSGSILISAYGRNISDDFMGHCFGSSTDGDKRLSPFVMKWDNELLKNLLAGFMTGDGCFNKNNGFQGVGVSKKLCEQIANICDRLSLEYSFTRTRKTENRQTCYNVRISRRSCSIFDGISCKYDESLYIGDDYFARNKPYFCEGNYICRKIISIEEKMYDGDVYDIEIENSHSYVANRISAHNSQFPINGFKLECKKKKVVKFYERLVDKLDLLKWMRLISHERFLLGDVFLFSEIDSPDIRGETDRPAFEWDHADGTIKRLMIMNPDWIEVSTTVLADEPEIVMLPDDELKKIVMMKQPRHIFDRLPDEIKQLVAAGRPIRLSSTVTSHIRHGGAPYGTYGDSILRRLFTTLAYKTKLMTANWIVAERLILPVRVVMIGEKDRPASEDDISDISAQLSAVANDPNLTIVTHHAFKYEWFGACYDDKTSFLTKKQGFVRAEDIIYEEDSIHEDMEIMVFDPKTGEMRYEKPLAFHVYDYEDYMIDFVGSKLDMSVTPNHTMLGYKRDKETAYSMEAKDFVKINECDRYVRSVAEFNSCEDLESVNVCNQEIPIDEFMKFAGYYLSEGCSEYKEDKRRYVVSVSQCPVVNPVYCEDIDSNMSAFEVIGSGVHKYEYEGKATTWNILNKEFAKQIGFWFGHFSGDKKIPSFIKNLPPHRLKILIESFINGDGARKEYQTTNGVQIGTNSKQLSEDLLEIMFKSGFAPTISRFLKKGSKNNQYVINCNMTEDGKGRFPRVKDSHINARFYKGKVWCFETSTGFFVTERNGRISIQGNTGKIHNINAELEYIGKEILDGLMLNQALLNGEGTSYASGQIGAESLIMRLETWRSELKGLIEKRIFLPVAQMQGFIDEEESNDAGEAVYLYPRIKWEDMRLRDNTNLQQMYIQLNQNGKISDRTLLEEFDLNYDQEVERIRDEQVQAMQDGQIMPGGGGDPMAGGGAGGMGAPGGGAAMPGAGPMGGGMGGEMGGEMGGPPGAMPGGDMGGGGMGAPGGMPAAAESGSKVYKRGKAPKAAGMSDEEQAAMLPVTVQLTGPEAKVHRMIKSMRLPYPVYVQFKQSKPGSQQPYMMDFAIPELRLDIECLPLGEIVQTINGSKLIENVSLEDELIGKNGDSVLISKIIKNNHEGDIIEIKPKGMPLLKTTKNHPIFVGKKMNKSVKRQESSIERCRKISWPESPEFIDAEDLRVGDYVSMPIRERNNNISCIDIDELKIDLTEDIGWLFGMYLAEGNSREKYSNVCFSLSCEEDEYADRIRGIFDDIFKANSSVYGSDKECSQRVFVFGKKISKFFEDNFGPVSYEKSLPSWVWNSPPEFIDGLLNGFCDGDGCRRENGDMRFISSTLELLLDVQSLILSAKGEFASLCVSRKSGNISKFGDKEYLKKGLWELSLLSNRKHSYHRIIDNICFVPIQSVSSSKYIGEVINFETEGKEESNHTFVAGNIVTHNCDGEKWHTETDDKKHDQERDMTLANMGWSVIRFSESAINEQIDQVQNVLNSNIEDIMKHTKKMKVSSSQGKVKTKVVYDSNSSSSSDIKNGFTSISKVVIDESKEG